MAIAFRSTATAGSGSGTDLVINKPSGAVDNDILIACIATTDINSAVAITGWTSILQTAYNGAPGGSGRLAILYKRASSEGSSYTATWGGASTWRWGYIAAYSGCITSGSPVDVSGSQASVGWDNNMVAPTVTTTTANTMLLFLGGSYNNVSPVTVPSGMTEELEYGGVYLADEARASAGATGSRTAVIGGGGNQTNVGAHVALLPASTDATVTGVLATATADGIAPSVSATQSPTVSAVVATAVASADSPTVSNGSAPTVTQVVARNLVPIRLTVKAQSPTGRSYRWAPDEVNAANVPNGLSFSTTIPGGFEQASLSLARKAKVRYEDLTEFTNIRVEGAGGVLAWEGRIEATPRESGDQKAISPQAVGWQAALEDDQTAVMPYVDRDLGHWNEPTAQRRVNLYALSAGAFLNVINGFEVESDSTSPALRLNLDSRASVGAVCEAWYDSKTTLGSVYYTWTGRNLLSGDIGRVDGASDSVATSSTSGTDVVTGASGTGTATETSVSGYRYAFALLARVASAISTDADRDLRLSTVAVYGNHGLTKRGTEPAAGFYASDIIGHAVATWAPVLSRSIDQTGFVIPHAAYLDYTTAAEIIRDANRFHLNDWGVWDDKTFYYYERGARGKTWRARIGPSNLQEAGPQVDKIWNGVLVSYPDVDGTTRTVGPTGSVADTTDANLSDTDPTNPVNAAGLRRWTKLDVSVITTQAGAIEIGKRFLAEANQLNGSGQATITGTVEDDHGVQYPAWKVRAGDYIQFIDASNTSARRIVRTSYDASSATNSIDLDSPSEALDALLERLGAVLVPLGL